LRDVSASLRLEYTQFLELEVFTRFGGMVDARTRKTIEHGRRIRAILSQDQYQPQPLGLQIALLLALSEGLLDGLTPEHVAALKARLPEWLVEHASAAVHRIEQTGELDEATRSALLGAMRTLGAALGLAEPAGQAVEAER
jgi:F0F1-type ATP synthase alpha subunit